MSPVALALVFLGALLADHRWHPRTRGQGKGREAARRAREAAGE